MRVAPLLSFAVTVEPLTPVTVTGVASPALEIQLYSPGVTGLPIESRPDVVAAALIVVVVVLVLVVLAFAFDAAEEVRIFIERLFAAFVVVPAFPFDAAEEARMFIERLFAAFVVVPAFPFDAAEELLVFIERLFAAFVVVMLAFPFDAAEDVLVFIELLLVAAAGLALAAAALALSSLSGADKFILFFPMKIELHRVGLFIGVRYSIIWSGVKVHT